MNTQRRRLIRFTAACSAALALPFPTRAQAFPSRPVRLVAPFAPGGPTDLFARLYATALGQQLGQTVIVDNKPGASGALGVLEVKRSAGDGHTLLFGTASTHVLYGLVQANPQFDAAEDFVQIGVLGGAPVAFGAAPNMPASLKTLFIASKANPDRYNYGSPGAGTLLHVAAERLRQLAQAPIRHIPYKGSGPARQDMLGGTIEMSVDTLGPLLPLHRSGKVRILGVATAKRLPMAPDVPTVAESADLGQPFESALWNIVSAPRDTPASVVQALSRATAAAMKDAKLLGQLEAQAMFADVHLGPQATAYMRSERAKLQPIVAGLGDLTRS